MRQVVKILWVFTSLFLLGIGFWIYNHLSDTSVTRTTQQLTESILELEKEADDLFEKYIPISFFSGETEKALNLTKKRWYLYARANDKTVFWNSNKVNLDSAVNHNANFPCYFKYGDDTYIVFHDKKEAYLAFRIANEGELHQRITSKYPALTDRILEGSSLRQFSGADTELTFRLKDSKKDVLLWSFLLVSLSLLSLTLYYTRRKHLFSLVSTAALIAINFLVYGVYHISWDDYFFLNGQSFQSISDKELTLRLFSHIFTISAVALTIFQLVDRLENSIRIFIQSIFLLFGLDFLINLTYNLAERSAISYDFEKLFSLSSYSFISIALIGFSFILFWHLTHRSFTTYKPNSARTLVTSTLAIFLFLAIQLIDGNRLWVSLWQPVIILILSFVVWTKTGTYRIKIYAHFLLSAILISILIYSGHKKREDNYLQYFAKTIIENKDPRAEQLLKKIENTLSQEFLTPEDYKNFMFKKDIIESRIKNLYFSNYLEKYELKLSSFGPNGENINENTLFSFEDLDKVYNEQTVRTESQYFYQITSPSNFSGYIAKYENCDIDGHFGSTFIILQPRVVQSEFLYPEVFANQKSEELITTNDYSYGIYLGGKLISQRGTYPYRLNETPDLNENSSVFSIGQFRHHSFLQDQYQVVLSKTENRIKSWMSAFTFSLIILFLICILTSFAAKLLLGPTNNMSLAFLPKASRYLSARIQTSLTIILLIGLLLSVYIIINYIRSGYNQNLENQLLVKVKNISGRLQNKIDLERKLTDPEQRVLMLNEESSTYKVDINLFNQSGKLLASTKPYLTAEEILGDHMNPKAFLQLTRQKNSQLLVQEELEGSDYLSAYVPLFNGKNEVIGYLNTPFFAKNEQLNLQISNLIINILNIYFLLLLGGILLAYIISRQISKPLILIREKIGKTALRGQNELISYNRDDEIGQLVKQYNKMVLELEESANQMAESEREGAWREMAKQVAHEIKNPLTPMKLSIQHLQRAYTSGPSEKLDTLFTKTSKLLIDQINSLSNMASEFSNFAKMPQNKTQNFDISDTLKNAVSLFKRSENIEIVSNIEPNTSVHADPEQLHRVFTNLIKNAIQAIPESRTGLIEVSLTVEQGTIEIKIKDNGNGIPESNYKKVFVPNFSTKNSGMGLGLAISKKIIETANGTILFKSKANIGTTFIIHLPQA